MAARKVRPLFVVEAPGYVRDHDGKIRIPVVVSHTVRRCRDGTVEESKLVAHISPEEILAELHHQTPREQS